MEEDEINFMSFEKFEKTKNFGTSIIATDLRPTNYNYHPTYKKFLSSKLGVRLQNIYSSKLFEVKSVRITSFLLKWTFLLKKRIKNFCNFVNRKQDSVSGNRK